MRRAAQESKVGNAMQLGVGHNQPSFLRKHHIRHSRESGNPASLACDITVQVSPIRIHGFNHLNLPSTIPFLDLLLSCDRAVRSFMLLVPNEQLYSMFFTES